MTHEEIFRRAEEQGADGAYSRITEAHPVGLHLGLERGSRALLVVCPKEPPEPPALAAIGVEVRHRQSGDWALVLTLRRADLKPLFSHLIDDLEEATRSSPQDPGATVVRRLNRWQRLLSPRPSQVLSVEELRGLAAELLFLADEAQPALGSRAAVAGWRGPYAAPKDFVFGEVEVEVKALRRLQRTLSISSLEQLSVSDRPLRIYTREVEIAGAEDRSSIPFASLVARVRSVVSADGSASEALEAALSAAGYEDRPEYEHITLRIGSAMTFAVDANFPCLNRGTAPAALVSCHYELLIAALDRFLVPTWGPAKG